MFYNAGLWRDHFIELENTLLGFKKCIELNIESIETDVILYIKVWKSKDGIVIIYHGGENGLITNF